MQTIQKNDFVFRVDVEKTKEYYAANTPCICPGCRNLYAQIATLSDSLKDFLAEFGVDICRPDESADIDNYPNMDYLFVGYTAVGSIETDGTYETDIDGLHITISKGDTPYYWFPNEQTQPHFFISITGISLPWILDEPFPRTERWLDKLKTFFKKKK